MRLMFPMMVTILLTATVTIYAGENKAPYLYYFSSEKQAFYIERADGTDSQILAHYQLPEDHDRVIGPGWSTSGEWLAWTTDAPGGRTFPNMHVHLVSRKGQEQISLLTELGNRVRVSGLRWSPKSDLLLITYFRTADTDSENIVVYNPNDHTFIVKIEAGELTNTWLKRVNWLPDGQSVSLFDGNNIYIVGLDGSSPQIISSHNDDVEFCTDFGSLPHFFADGRIAFLKPDGTDLIITDKNIQNQIDIGLPEGHITLLDWSPDEKYALVYIQPEEAEFKYELWFLDVETKSAKLSSKDVWFINNCNSPFKETAWNVSHQAIYIDGDGSLNLLIANPFLVSRIDVPVKGKMLVGSEFRWTSHEQILFIWRSRELYGNQIYIYDPLSKLTHILATSDIGQTINSSFVSKTMGDYFAYSESYGGVIAHLQDGKQAEFTLQVDPNYGSAAISGMVWHPSGEWLYLLGSISQTFSFINIINSDGTQQRQLTVCPTDSKSCFGWLPTD